MNRHQAELAVAEVRSDMLGGKYQQARLADFFKAAEIYVRNGSLRDYLAARESELNRRNSSFQAKQAPGIQRYKIGQILSNYSFER